MVKLIEAVASVMKSWHHVPADTVPKDGPLAWKSTGEAYRAPICLRETISGDSHQEYTGPRSHGFMKSHEVLKRAADRVGVKALAAELKLSQALIYKWCQESDPSDPDTSGARNPLDRLADIVRVTNDLRVCNWLCHEAGGFFVKNPPETSMDLDTELLGNTQRLVTEFSQLLLTVTRSIEDDGEIEPVEADKIRDAWEDFKFLVETFVVSCERGRFHSS